MSNHAIEVVRLDDLHPHPNADKLAIVHVRGYTVCVNLDDWKVGDLAAYIPPDSVVPNTEQFAFLGGHLRVRAKKLRGVISFGLLVPAPAGSTAGQDVAEQLGITHYEPPLPLDGGGDIELGPPDFVGSKYDIENLRRYPGVIPDWTPVQITEKIHGACARYTFRDGRLWAGSRAAWKAESDRSIWWIAIKTCPQIEGFCQDTGCTLYGEVFGRVQELRYGLPNSIRFAAFDVAMPNGSFVNAEKANAMLAEHGIPSVPLLYRSVPYSFDFCAAAAEGESVVPGADHVREGVVVKPLTEMHSAGVGRVIFKCVGGGYLLRKG